MTVGFSSGPTLCPDEHPFMSGVRCELSPEHPAPHQHTYRGWRFLWDESGSWGAPAPGARDEPDD